MSLNQKWIVIAGGGITGLTAAFYLQKKIKEEKLPFRLILLEKGERLGGKIETDHVDGFVIEKGPDSFLARKTAIMDLTRELGLESELVGTNPAARKNYIMHHNKLHLMPPGLVLGIPTKLGPFVKTGLISPLGKLRAAMDLVIPPRKEEGDESLGGFLQRRLGKEVAENIAEPLLSGIYAGDTQNLSLEATFPQFKEIERKYHSIIKGMLLSRKAGPRKPVAEKPSTLPAKARNSMFLTYQNGLETLVDRLVEVMDEVDVRLHQEILEVVCKGKQYEIKTADGVLAADAVIVATPAFAARKMLSGVKEKDLLSHIPYVSVANVALAYKQEDIEYPLDAGSGFVIPRNEGRKITACTWTSSKWPQTTPKDRVLLRCYIGHSKEQDQVYSSDEALVSYAREEVKRIMGITADPIFTRVNRWEKAMPQYEVNHLQRLELLHQQMKEAYPGVYLAGAGYRGVGIPDCIQQGKEAAQQLLEFLQA
ncbi:protoporphyrinogen oxidase [Ammoniphilus resinae]|uniref:Coproporphyrinogen III oxidase n=1 Tax=Ammoniphilus resinae TaxID=861532 RepID=A0ABS4GM17_9BACL|nr:protoporphyrinogen oxidase [Ammoniphilus resinae]MBP1931152.1 oxygen-dependent protoporphyrinogen oxidase [Ammoniphilus resinae]